LLVAVAAVELSITAAVAALVDIVHLHQHHLLLGPHTP
jgi:hypothetical protein